MVELTEVKAYLGITGTDDDTQLQDILDGINAQIVNNIGDISIGVKTMTVKNSAVHNGMFTLNIINPTDLTEINGNNVSSLVNGTDYLIKSDGDVIIKDLSTYTQNDFGYFTVKFNAGYTDTPKQLIALVSNYLGYLYSQDLGKDVTSEQLGPREVEYGGNMTADGKLGNNSPLKTFKLGLKQFIPLALRIY